jgi:hypothetical protein
MVGKMLKGQGGGKFKKRGLHGPRSLTHSFNACYHLERLDALPVDTDSLPKVPKVGRSEQPGFETAGLQNRGHGMADRTFAVGTRHMNDKPHTILGLVQKLT